MTFENDSYIAEIKRLLRLPHISKLSVAKSRSAGEDVVPL